MRFIGYLRRDEAPKIGYLRPIKRGGNGGREAEIKD